MGSGLFVVMTTVLMWHWELLTKLAKGQRTVFTPGGMARSGMDLTLLDIKWRSGALNVPQVSHYGVDVGIDDKREPIPI